MTAQAELEIVEKLVNAFEQGKLSRRELVASLLAATGVMTVAPGALAQAPAPVAIGRSMNHVSLAVSDVARSAEFYQRVLGLDIISRPANGGLNM